MPYETDLRVPLMMIGPSIRPMELESAAVITLDLAPTLIEIAGLDYQNYGMDGISLWPQIHQQNSAILDRTFLVEYHGEAGNGNDPRCPNSQELSECSFEWGCKCQDSRNNTYQCLRRLKTDEDTLFCTFSDSSGTKELYDMTRDPFQLHNLVNQDHQGNYFSLEILNHLVHCKGYVDCNKY